MSNPTAREAGDKRKAWGVSPREATVKSLSSPAKRATGATNQTNQSSYSCDSCRPLRGLDKLLGALSWGLRSRLYASVCFADSFHFDLDNCNSTGRDLNTNMVISKRDRFIDRPINRILNLLAGH